MSIRIGNNIIASTGSVAGHNKDTSAHPDIRQLIDTKQDKGDYSTRQEVDSKVNAAKSELQAKINAKQDTLVSATNIKTINGQSILGPGNIFIQGGGEGGVESVNGKDGVVVLTGEDLVATVDEQTDTLQGHLQTLANKDESLEAQISTKQNTLIPGDNITIEGNVISATGGDIPEGVYTRDNLLAGKGIEIIPEPVEGVIDEYTLACFHFDNGLNYETIDGIKETIVDYDGNAGTTSSYYKFGTKSCYSGGMPNVARIENPSLSLNNNFTIDFWIYRTSSDLGYIGLCDRNEINSSNRCCIFGCNYYYPYILIKNSNGTSRINMTSAELPVNKWTHVAITYDASNEYGKLACFIDGVKKIEENTILKDGITFSKYMFVQAAGQGYIDELRYSNIVRYTSDFTPMNKPYSVAAPTGNYVINSTQDALDIKLLEGATI